MTMKALTEKMTALMILIAGGASWDEAREQGYTYNTLKGVVDRGLVIIPQDIEDGLIITDLGREMFPAPAEGVKESETPAPSAEVVAEIQALIKHDLLHVARSKAAEAGLEYVVKCLDNNLPVWAEIELSKLTVTPPAPAAEEVEEEKVPGQWEVQSNYMGHNRFIFQVYRCIDPAQPQHSGNMEHYRDPDGKGVWHTKAEAQAVCDALNAPPAEGVEYEVTEELLAEVNACCHNGHGCSLFYREGRIDTYESIDCNSMIARGVIGEQGKEDDYRLCYIGQPVDAEELQDIINEAIADRKRREAEAEAHRSAMPY
jgi:hypothetical protein